MSKDAVETVPAPADDAVKILIDSPSVQPKLRFGDTASGLAQIIRESPPRFAVGIFGDWGAACRGSSSARPASGGEVAL